YQRSECFKKVQRTLAIINLTTALTGRAERVVLMTRRRAKASESKNAEFSKFFRPFFLYFYKFYFRTSFAFCRAPRAPSPLNPLTLLTRQPPLFSICLVSRRFSFGRICLLVRLR